MPHVAVVAAAAAAVEAFHGDSDAADVDAVSDCTCFYNQ